MQNIQYDAPFEPVFIEALRQLVEEKITFNHVIGLKLTGVSANVLTGRIHMRPELVGHFSYNRLHGGVTSAALDTLGGLACMVNITMKHLDETPEQRIARFLKIGTIDYVSTIWVQRLVNSLMYVLRLCVWGHASDSHK